MAGRETTARANGGAHRLDLGRYLPYRLSRLAGRVSRGLARLYADRFDLSIPQWRVLAVLAQSTGPCADDVCRVTGMDKVTVSRAVHALRAQGRLTRRPDGDDRRRVRIDLTAAGREVYEQVAPLALELEERLLGELGDEERRRFERALAKLERVAAVLDDTGVAP
jgi:DNA-binding MarR family transcriptional regulator